MRVRYLKSSNVNELESNVNLLLSQGFEFQRDIVVLPNGIDYLVSMVHYDRPPRGEARAADFPPRGERVAYGSPHLPSIACAEPREVISSITATEIINQRE